MMLSGPKETITPSGDESNSQSAENMRETQLKAIVDMICLEIKNLKSIKPGEAGTILTSDEKGAYCWKPS